MLQGFDSRQRHRGLRPGGGGAGQWAAERGEDPAAHGDGPHHDAGDARDPDHEPAAADVRLLPHGGARGI